MERESPYKRFCLVRLSLLVFAPDEELAAFAGTAKYFKVGHVAGLHTESPAAVREVGLPGYIEMPAFPAVRMLLSTHVAERPGASAWLGKIYPLTHGCTIFSVPSTRPPQASSLARSCNKFSRASRAF